MKSIRKAIRRALKLVFRLGEVLLVIAAAGIVYFFCLFSKGPHEYDVLQKDAIAGIQKAEEAAGRTHPTLSKYFNPTNLPHYSLFIIHL